MKVVKTAMVMICMLLCLSPSLLAKPGAPGNAMKAAKSAAKAWLALVDSGRYAEGWTEMAPAAKAKVTKEAWIGDLKKARGPVGKVMSRKFKNSTYAKNPPGAPAGEYEILHFTTDFTNLRPVTETVSMMFGPGGKWRVAGYFLRPAD